MTLDVPNPMAPADDVESELDAFLHFLRVDEERWKLASGDAAIVLEDRSIHTLLAHASANGAVQGYDATAVTCRRARHVQFRLVPDVVLLLNPGLEVLQHRYETLPHTLHPRLTDPRFNHLFYDYFDAPCVGTPASVIKYGDLDIVTLANRAVTAIEDHL